MERVDRTASWSLLVLVLTGCSAGSPAAGAAEGAGSDGGTGAETAANDDAGADGSAAHDASSAAQDAASDAPSAEAATGDGQAPPPQVPQHFPSASYAYAFGAWMNADPADVRYYLTFAEMPFSKRDVCANTLKDGDCFSLMYMDTDRVYLPAPGAQAGCASVEDGASYGSLPETSFVHAAGTSASAAERLRGYYGTVSAASGAQCPVLGYAGNDGDKSSGGLIAHWQAWAAKNDDGKLGGFFHDDFNSDGFDWYLKGGMCPPFTGTEGAGTVYCQAALEYPDVASLQAAHHAILDAVVRPATHAPMPTLYNGCPAPGGPSWYTSGVLSDPVDFELDPATRAVALGCMGEGTLSASAPARVDQIPGTGVYAKNVATLLNDITLAAAPGFSYVLLDYGDPDASLRLNERYFDLGVAWLAYQPGTRNVVQWDDFAWDATDATEFYPEQLLVPWAPSTSMAPYDPAAKTHGEHDLRVDTFAYEDASGRAVEAAMYCREFASLYQGRLRTEGGAPVRIGSGAVCVNTSDSARPVLAKYLHGTYAHVVTFPAGAVDDPNAKLDTTAPFVPGQTQVAAGSAVFVVGP